MSEDFQSELSELTARLMEIERGTLDEKCRLAKIESVNHAVICRLLTRQSQIADVAKSLANLGSQIQDAKSFLLNEPNDR